MAWQDLPGPLFLRRQYAFPGVSWLSWTAAAMCRAWLTRRFPARESRWRTCSPEEASNGAVPFHDAKWAGDRRSQR
jgi:hypothetical protein